MTWRRPGDKPLCKPMIVCLLTHICVARPQWFNKTYTIFLKQNATENVVCKISAVLSWSRWDNTQGEMVRLIWCSCRPDKTVNESWVDIATGLGALGILFAKFIIEKSRFAKCMIYCWEIHLIIVVIWTQSMNELHQFPYNKDTPRIGWIYWAMGANCSSPMQTASYPSLV